MLITREYFEAGLLAATTLQLGHSLLALGYAGCQWDTMALAGLALLSMLQEQSSAHLLKGGRYETRKADSQGTALGALAMPWTFASLVAYTLKLLGQADFSMFALRGSVASSAAMLACFAVNSTPAAKVKAGEAEAANGPAQRKQTAPGRLTPSYKNAAGKFLLPAALAVVVALAVSAPLMQGVSSWGTPDGFQWGRLQMNGTSAAVGVAVNATAGAGGVHLMLMHLPNCFTLGEAIVVTQAATLLAVDVAVIAISAGAAAFGLYTTAEPTKSSSTNSLQILGLGERNPMQLFAELLLLAALVVGCACAPLLRSIFSEGSHCSMRGKQAGYLLGDLLVNGHGPGACASDRGVSARCKAELLANGAVVADNQCSGTNAEADIQIQGVISSHKRADGPLRILLLLRDGRVAAICAILCLAVAAAVRPALWALSFALSTPRRVAVLGYWSAILALALPFMDWISRTCAVQTIIVRKGYHLLALALFAPALILEPQLLAISLAIACALLIAVEVLRIGNVPVAGPRIHRFMTSFIDARDSGILLVSHFSLLVGMAVPVWLTANSSQPVANSDLTAAFAGIITLGVSDSAASALGRRYGRHRILGTKKTLEGTAGGIACTLLAWVVISMLCPVCGGSRTWGHFMYATVSSCLLEAATTQLDNLFLPLHHFAMLVS